MLLHWKYWAHDNALIYRTKSVKTRWTKIEMEECACPAQSPALNSTKDLEHHLYTRPPHLTSVSDLINALVADP